MGILLLIFYTFQQQFHYLAGRFGYGSTRAKDGHHTGFIQEVIILCRDDTSGKDQNIFTSQTLQFGNDLRNQGFVSGSQ